MYLTDTQDLEVELSVYHFHYLKIFKNARQKSIYKYQLFVHFKAIWTDAI